jgi:predicted DNA-binding transcriptional regulator AlpA
VEPRVDPKPDDLLQATEVAEILRISPITLANWRSRRKGPRFVRVGQRMVRYRRADLDRFITDTSTPAV